MSENIEFPISKLILGKHRKYFGYLLHKVFSVRAGNCIKFDLIPSLVVLILCQYAKFTLRYFNIEFFDLLIPSWIVEVRNRVSAFS